jgi:branched-subunit amino acid transport protein AzlD
MNERTIRHLLFTVLVLMAAVALYLHLRIHPFLVPDKANPGQTLFMGSFLPASIFPLLDLVVVSLLFTTRRTAVYGYVLNGMLVIFGTVLMTHLSIVMLAAEPPQPFYQLLFKSTLPDIGLAWADFLVGAALYYTWLREPAGKKGQEHLTAAL